MSEWGISRPVQDVIESYSAGHTDLVFKVKAIQTRLDQILGGQGSKARDVYDSKTSLASKIVNIERQVDSIDEKLQLFIEMYQKDRKRLSDEVASRMVSSRPESNSETPSKAYEQQVASEKEASLENFVALMTEVSSPESEMNLPSLSSSSTITSVYAAADLAAASDVLKTKTASRSPMLSMHEC